MTLTTPRLGRLALLFLLTVSLLGVFVLSCPTFAMQTELLGGGGGTPFIAPCPQGFYLVGLMGRTGAWVDRISPVCAPWLGAQHTFGPITTGQVHGSSNGGQPVRRVCPIGAAIVRWETSYTRTGQSGIAFVASITATCLSIERPGTGQTIQVGSLPEEHGPLHAPAQFNVTGVPAECPADQIGVGVHGRAGLFVDRIGLICGPKPVPVGAIVPSQAMNTPSAFPTAPRIDSPSPNGYLVKGKGVFKITPSKYLSGTQAQVQLKWLNPPAHQQSKGLDFYNYEVPMALIGSANGIDAPAIYLAPGTWEMRVRINQPKVGEWSDWVRFEYYLQHPGLMPKSDVQFGVEGQRKSGTMGSGANIFRPQTTPQQGLGETTLIRPRGVEGKDDTTSTETVGTSPQPEKKP